MHLEQFAAKNPDLWAAVQEWIREGWGVSDDMEISALMVAAALEKEARTQDECVKSGESAAEYPKRLRLLAVSLAAGGICRVMRQLTKG